MKQHKLIYFFEKTERELQYKDYGDFYCKKCDQCVCFSCIKYKIDKNLYELLINNYTEIVGEYLPEPLLGFNINLILNNHECKVSDEEYIIKSIIE